MDAPILATKLYIPPPPPKGVLRPRLIERLNEGLHRKLTLISAPAGFGKTSLVSEWLVSEWIAGHSQQCAPEVCVAWLSLDEGDSDPARFLTYLVAALRTVMPNIGERVMEALQSPQPPPYEPILTVLLNEIINIPADFVLVLDDYHLIDARAVDASNSVDASETVDGALTFLLDHLPPQMHLVIATREDPQLPLARLRARNQLTELRASDLRFTPSEANGFLQAMRLNLSAEDVEALEDRTEGWIAGLQLAALALQGTLAMHETFSMESHPGVSDFIQAFAGDHRYIVDYLVEEVLQRQPQPVRSFLLQTAILDQLNGPLCDAVTGQEGGSVRLEALQRGNFFVVPLDDKRHWYRYHHLFAQVLSVHLMMEQPAQVPALHRRASEWYEQHGSPADAIHHALAGGDFERAADLVERTMPAMRRSRQEATLLGWLRALPDELVRRRPILSVHYAGALLQSGQIEGVEARLRDAERWLGTPADRSEQPEDSPADMVVVEEAEFRHLSGWIAIYRAGIALALGEVHNTVKFGRLALDRIPEEDHLGRGAAAGLLGLASWARGDLEAAHRLYADSMARLLKAGHTSDTIGLSISLADIQIAQGRLTDALRTYERGLQLATEQGTPVLRGAADMLVGMSEIHRERNDFNAATQHLLRSKELGELKELAQNPYRWRVVMARIREARGDLDGALDLLNEAERRYRSDFSPNVRPIAAMRARVWAAQGRLDEALDWARAQGLSAEDNLSYLREYEHSTLARVLLAQYQRDRTDSTIREAVGLLERLLNAAEEGGRTGSVIEILALQALAHQSLGDIPAALAPLERALMLAEPEGYIRIFVDEGLPMAQLLRVAAAHEILSRQGLAAFTGKLLGAFKDEQLRSAGNAPFPTSQPGNMPAQPAKGTLVEPEVRPTQNMLVEPEVRPTQNMLVEPLSERELDVLRLFKTDLSGPEIAQELVIALSTVRTHTKSIYSKLNVNSRRAAVKRAEELHLI